MFGINILALVKAELLKYKDKKGNPLAFDVLDDLQKSLAVIDSFVSKLTLGDIQAILGMLPPSVTAKFPPGELATVATEIASLPVELKALEAELAAIEVDLKK
jgi:hypothetical protein